MFSHVCVAGTFDSLHRGHQMLLEAAFMHGDKVTVALTSDAFVQQYKGTKGVSSFASRKKSLVAWIRKKGWSRRSTVVHIDDPVGTAATDDFDALIVTSQNKKTGEQINDLRGKLGRPPLTLIEISLIDAQDHVPISSTRVRSGEIDTQGKIVMPDSMREELSQPLGRVLINTQMLAESLEMHKSAVVISVGDMTTKTLIDRGVVPNLTIVDGKVNRKEFSELSEWISQHKKETKHFVSGPRFIAHAVSDAIAAWSKKPKQHSIFVIDGEEDLLVLPAVLYAPVGSVIYYGQPPVTAWACGPEYEGVVEVIVSDSIKSRAKELLVRFE